VTRPDQYKDCTAWCERIVHCVVCGLRKSPSGRDPGVAASNGYCAYECSGRYKDPEPGHLWPGELARMDEPEEDA
jgi:hypothetical protein